MGNLIHFVQAGGFVMYPLILLSVLAVIVIVERFLAFRQLGNLAKGLPARVSEMVGSGNFDAAIAACKQQEGPVAACLLVVLENRRRAETDIERIAEEVGQEYFVRLERLLPVLDTTTTISPLLGLLGTVTGMIGTFNAIASSRGQGNTDAVMSGVGEALYATATGLLVAIVCFVAYNYFGARIRAITTETEQAVTRLLIQLAQQRTDSAV